MILRRVFAAPIVVALLLLSSTSAVLAAEESFDEKINSGLAPVAKFLIQTVFFPVKIMGEDVPVVLLVLAGTALFLSIYFRFINLRAFGLALRTVRGKYSTKDSPGQITHFQALSTALSATVGLGNIAGVALAIGIGGPGAVLWMIMMGFLGMTSKFTECTLGVKYRKIDENGNAHGGGMFYLRDGLKEKGLGPLGMVLAVLFAVACIGGALGAGNMFQINQAHAQFSETFNVFSKDGGYAWVFGLMVAVLVGSVIIGGIVWIARVTEFLVPIMCVTYLVACAVVLFVNLGDVPAALGTIVKEAFNPTAAAGGFIGGLIQGIRRGVFSNEAGVGSAAIAHSAVKTDHPASEGVVALLEPFVDTVIVCTMTALVIVVTGMWKVNADVSADEVALLSSPATGAAEVVSFKKGEMLKVEDNWLRVTSSDGKEGWVTAGSASKVKDAKNEFEVGEGGAKLQKNPKKDAEVIVTVAAMETLNGKQHWAFVTDKEGSQKGWILAASYGTNKKGEMDWVATESLKTRAGTGGGIWLTSQAFKSVIGWFPVILAIAVFLFAFSTMISWSYYGEQALGFLTGGNSAVTMGYKIAFCLCIVIGSVASLGNVLDISDMLFFAMVLPNMIGLYILLPVVKAELAKFRAHADKIDAKDGK